MSLALGIERVTLHTPRLVLEPLGPEHADALWLAAEPSLAQLRPWLGWTARATARTIRDFAAGREPEWRAGTSFTFAIVVDGAPSGVCGLHIYNPALPQGEIGYWIATSESGRGYTTEATKAVRDFAFEQTGRHRLNLRAGVDNLASQKVAENAGFTREGLMRDGGSSATGFYDCFLYGMLETDPRP